MATFVPTKQHLQEALLLCFNLEKNAAERHRLLCEAYGEHAPPIKTCEYWFRRFKSGKKLMVCIWWDQLGVVYYELLQPNETITAECYQQQLMQLSRTLKFKYPQYAKKRDKVIFHHDNAQPHVAKVVKETLEALNWDILPHSLYSPDIAPSDYQLFWSMAHGLAEQHFTSCEEAKNWVDSWIASKDEEFFKRGIRTHGKVSLDKRSLKRSEFVHKRSLCRSLIQAIA